MPRANLLVEEGVLSLPFCPMRAPTDVKGATCMERPGHLPGISTVGRDSTWNLWLTVITRGGFGLSSHTLQHFCTNASTVACTSSTRIIPP